MKSSINEMKNAIESIQNWADHMEERISKLKNRNLEIIQVEEKRFFFSKWRNSVRTVWVHQEKQHKVNEYPPNRRKGEGSSEFILKNNSWELLNHGEGTGQTIPQN